jgi:hypothetical protein
MVKVDDHAKPTPIIGSNKRAGSVIKNMLIKPTPPMMREIMCVYFFPILLASRGNKKAVNAEIPL